MKRKLLFLERILYGDGTQPFHGVFALRLSGGISFENLETALAKLQAKHPLLNSCIHTDAKGHPWFFPASNPVPIRVVSRVDDNHWERETVAEWAAPFPVETGPLLRMVWLRSENVSDLILTFHHCLCDGGSGVALLADILMVLDNPAADPGTSPAFTSVADLIPEQVRKSLRTRCKAKVAATAVRAGLSVMTTFLPERKEALIPREQDYLLNWKLSAGESALLMETCKKNGVTVNTALGQAFLEAFGAVRGEAARGKATCPIDIRRYVPAIRKDTVFAFGLALGLQRGKAGEDFTAAVRNQQKSVDSQLERLNPYEFLMTMESSHGSVKPLRKFLTYSKPGNDFMFSNMGRLPIPADYRNFRVETIFSPTVIGPFGNPNTLIASTYHNRLDFSFVSNHCFMPYREAVLIRDKAVQILSDWTAHSRPS